LCLFVALGLSLSLASYHASDPSLNNSTFVAKPENWVGRLGAILADLLYQGFGLAAWLAPAVLLLAGVHWVRNRRMESPIVRVAGYGVMIVCVASALTILSPAHPFGDSFEIGGVAGHLMATSLTLYLNTLGALLLLAALFVTSLYLVSSFSVASAADAAAVWLTDLLPKRRRKEAPDLVYVGEAEPQPEPRRGGRRGFQDTAPVLESPGLLADLEPPPIQDQVAAEEAARLLRGFPESPAFEDGGPPPWDEEAVEIPIRSLADEPLSDPGIRPFAPEPVKKAARKSEPARQTAFKLPSTKLLNPPPDREGYDSAELKDVAGRIKEKLGEFNVQGNVVQINPGPVVTTFEFKPDAGVKIAKITTLSEDLCLGLQAESILIERIPGKPTVGIEVPNTRREMISLRAILESDEFREAASRLTIALGKDISGRIRVTELEKMPHLLIAGSTGSGKSVMLNTLIMSVLYKSTPDEVRLILVDPKRVELGIYDGIPHLLTPVITEPKKAVNALRNAVMEMERRLKLLAEHRCRNIDQFNKKVRQMREKPLELFPEDGSAELAEEPLKPLPFILVIIDELADLMMLERAGVEESVIRLAQMARAVGIHLVLATQRPSVDVITGLIKANFPARISFRVATRVDSRTVLDVMGAEHLLGKGDMLFLPPGTSRLLRVHGAFVTESEISDVCEFWKEQARPDYDHAFLIAPPSDDDEDAGDEEFDGTEDPMYQDAVKVVLQMGKASTSILQRRLRLGYGRAARILDMMEREGIIGPPDGSRPREVLKRPDWLDEVEASLR
jgi:S-DNA-T family DNA segregation ATPase FtsK/SpoIIIE